MRKFENKYRIPSARAAWWNYSNPGSYFITICTHEMRHRFGYIKNETIFLSDIGRIVEEEWSISFDIRKELFCEAFVIMPNHLHAILRIEPSDDLIGASVAHGVAVRAPRSISSFVAGFKAAATKRVHLLPHAPKRLWKARFHDRLIRDEAAYLNIARYIDKNPERWGKDKFNGGR
jgi:putative transposase